MEQNFYKNAFHELVDAKRASGAGARGVSRHSVPAPSIPRLKIHAVTPTQFFVPLVTVFNVSFGVIIQYR
jgi:hypothetical protein